MYEGEGGSVEDAVEFILQNFTEMNKLWVRMQHQVGARPGEMDPPCKGICDCPAPVMNSVVKLTWPRGRATEQARLLVGGQGGWARRLARLQCRDVKQRSTATRLRPLATCSAE